MPRRCGRVFFFSMQITSFTKFILCLTLWGEGCPPRSDKRWYSTYTAGKRLFLGWLFLSNLSSWDSRGSSRTSQSKVSSASPACVLNIPKNRESTTSLGNLILVFDYSHSKKINKKLLLFCLYFKFFLSLCSEESVEQSSLLSFHQVEDPQRDISSLDVFLSFLKYVVQLPNLWKHRLSYPSFPRPPTPHFYWSVLASCCSICCHPLLEGWMFSLDACQLFLLLHIPTLPFSSPWHAGSQLEGGQWFGGLPQVRYPQGGQNLGPELRGFFSWGEKKEINLIFPSTYVH